eukprot:gene15227-15373_t
MTEANPEHASKLPAHIEDAISSMAKLHIDHHEKAGALQRWVERVTALFGRPEFTPALTGLIVFWICLNLGLGALGYKAMDPPPFTFMSGLVSLAALSMAGMILTTQRRESELTTRREQLTLELSILTEQKVAKLIELVELLRHDHPDIADRVDMEAQEMSASADLHEVLEAIKSSHATDDNRP